MYVQNTLFTSDSAAVATLNVSLIVHVSILTLIHPLIYNDPDICFVHLKIRKRSTVSYHKKPMKNTFALVILLFCSTLLCQARLNKTVEVTAGNLATVLTVGDLDTLTHLTLKGSLDSRDFALFRSKKFYSLTDLNLKDVTIEAFGSYPKNTLPYKAFVFCIDLKNVTLPTSLVAIGDSAFYSCTGLKSVTILDSTRSIGIGSFRKCLKLNTVLLPSSLTTIGDVAFDCCPVLTTMTLPASVTFIGKCAFVSNPLDTPIPDSIKHIGIGAFIGTNITKAIIPGQLDSIPQALFRNCHDLASVSIPATVSYIGNSAFEGSGIAEINLPISIDSVRESTFSDCAHLDVVNLPSSIKYIGEKAFQNCSALPTITLPASISTIANYAFYNCSGLTSFVVESPTPIDLTDSYHVFDFIDKRICTLYVPKGSLYAYENAVGWNDFVRISEVQDTTTHESGDTTSIVKNVVISAGGLRAALTDNELNNITELTLTGDIDYRDFVTMRYWMPKLSVVDLRNTTVKEYNAKYQDNEIPYDAFRNCSALTKVVLPSKLLSIDENVFCNCTNLNEVVFSDSLFNISKNAFLGCTSLVSIEIPTQLGIIGEGSFSECTNLTRITLPNSISYIGNLAFKRCARLKEVRIPSKLYSISTGSFAGCEELSKVNFSNQLEVIGSWAFTDCIGLTSLTIPESVNLIEDAAFIGCKNIQAIYSPSEWPADCGSELVFSGIGSTCTLFVPFDSKINYETSTGWRQIKNITETSMVAQKKAPGSNMHVWVDQTTEVLHVENLDKADRVDLIDLKGCIRRSKSGSTCPSISMHGLNDGIYFVQVTTAKRRLMHKIVKK